MKKLKFKENLRVTKTITLKEASYFNKLDGETQRYLYELFCDSEDAFKEEFNNMYYEGKPEEKDKAEEKQNKKVEKEAKVMVKESDKLKRFFATQGIANPNSVTTAAFVKQDFQANFDNFYNSVGMLTLNMEKQAQYNYYKSQQKQNFIQIAQNDALLTQNDKLIEQNATMIELMQQLVNK